MSTTKYVLRAVVLALASSVAVFFAVGYVLADHWKVETKRSIPMPSAPLRTKLVDLQSWFKWSAMDFQLGNPTTRQCEGVAGEGGQCATWQGPKGVAVVRLTKVGQTLVDYDISYKFGPEGSTFGGQFTGTIVWQDKGGSTEITWTEYGQLSSIAHRWSNWFGALQDKVHQVQRASLAGLEESVRRGEADEASQLGK